MRTEIMMSGLMSNKISQKQLAFYTLLKSHLKDKKDFVKTWECVGEIYIKELHKRKLASYKCPTRLTELFKENIGMLERTKVERDGYFYYQYKIKNLKKMTENTIIRFYKELGYGKK